MAAPRTNNDYFGVGVALDGDTAYIGAMGLDDTNSSYVGYIQIFSRCPTGWIAGNRIYAPTNYRDYGDSFGNDIALDRDTAVVGAWRDDPTNSWGDPIINAGAAYVYNRSGTNWQFATRLTADDAAYDDGYGESVAIADNTIFVGAHRVDNAGRSDVGAIYIYRTNALGQWVQAAPRLIPTNGWDGESFGVRISAESNLLLAGAWTSSSTNVPNCGTVYVYSFTSMPPATVTNALTAFDSFNEYPAGALNGRSNSMEAGATGWSTAWNNATSCCIKAPGNPLMYFDQASGIGLCGGTRVMAVTNGISGHALAALRGLALETANLTNLYVSFLLHAVTPPGSGVTNLLSVGSGINPEGAPYTGVMADSYYASSRTAPAGETATGFTQAQTCFLVARYTAAPGAYNNWNKVQLYVNPTSAILPQAELILEDTGGTPAKQNTLRTATGNFGSANEYWIDEIRIGTSWSSVTPLASSTSDCDGDGLPDNWELRWFGSMTNAVAALDPDGDGYINAEEYIALTDPTNAASFMCVTTIRRAANGINIQVNSHTGRVYRLEWRTNLMNGSWQPVRGWTNYPGADEPFMNLWDTNAENAERYYRTGIALP
jgi:hypothetical protein